MNVMVRRLPDGVLWIWVNLKCLHDVWLLTWNNTRSHWETSRPPVSIIVSWWYQKMMPHFEQYSECRKTLMWLCSLVLGWLIVLGCIFSVTLKPSEAGSLRLLRRFHRITLNAGTDLWQEWGSPPFNLHLCFFFFFCSLKKVSKERPTYTELMVSVSVLTDYKHDFPASTL